MKSYLKPHYLQYYYQVGYHLMSTFYPMPKYLDKLDKAKHDV